jgi:hypothetical protein
MILFDLDKKDSSSSNDLLVMKNKVDKKNHDAFLKKKSDRTIEINLDRSENESTNRQKKNTQTDDDAKHFYVTRLKHGLIVSFLVLIPIQNSILFLISQLFEYVNRSFV